MYATLKNQFYRWLFRLNGPESGTIVLVQRRIFILPTRHGFVFAAVIVLMLTGSVNYTLSLGFVLTFLLGAMGINAMLHTFRNLASLRISATRTPPVFEGERARFTICLDNPTETARYSIALTSDKREATYVDVAPNAFSLVGVSVPAARRGVLHPGRLTLFTRYPLGLYYAWAHIELDMTCIVYPRPSPPGQPLPRTSPSTGEGSRHSQGRDDFSGLRAYSPGDSPRHIAWKAAARDRGLLTKQFAGRSDAQLWLSWNDLPERMGTEEKLSQLARWVLDAHASGLSFGVRIPGKTVPLATGDAQRDLCLEALALFEPHG
jgi:uncharacterized protein (DUF58 family)